MNIYSIHFCGHYPVGAVAVVIAKTPEEALEVFQKKLAEEEPLLVDHNIGKLSPEPTLIWSELQSVPACSILLNGNY